MFIPFKVKFSFKLGWFYGTGPGCTPNNIGNLTTGGNYDYWRCTSGCGGTTNMNDINYVCTGASIEDLWEQREGLYLQLHRSWTFHRVVRLSF